MDHLVIIDGHHLMYRAYWAIPRTLSTKAGEQTNAVFGFASMLINILNAEQPDSFIICFDEGSTTFRHQESETYKDGRAETPDDFYEQIPRIDECTQAFGFARVSDPQYEADDFLCSYAKAAEAKGMKVTIVTGDRDAFQIASPKVQIAIPHKGYHQQEYLDDKGVFAKYGIHPAQVPAYKGLMGDSSDNLPGVKGIGPKTASTLLQQYKSLEGIYEHLDEIKDSWKQKLEADKEQAFFCQQMATLVPDIPLPITLNKTKINTKKDIKPLLEFFTELEFTLLIRRLNELLKTPYGKDIYSGAEEAEFITKTDKGLNNQLALF